MDNSVKLIQWDGIKSVFLIALLSTFGFLGFLAKGLIINYVLRFAPKNRPINTLIAIDQVRIIVWKISVDAKNNFVWRIFSLILRESYNFHRFMRLKSCVPYGTTEEGNINFSFINNELKVACNCSTLVY